MAGLTLVTSISFAETNGAYPYASLVFDANGDLFGTTAGGGSNGYGTVFEIANYGTLTAPIFATTPTTLVSFNWTNGADPYGSLIIDANGDLFGTTAFGGTNGVGTVFEIANNGTLAAPSYATPPATLVGFNSTNGAHSFSNLIIDANGDLLGTTAGGGSSGDGTVFEIKNKGTLAAPIFATTPTALVSFNWINGAEPRGGLTVDANGDLFGTTAGGGSSGGGTVFEIKNKGTLAAPIFATTPTTLVSFNGINGAEPCGGLTIDANGDLFGTTAFGGTNDDGTVFEIINNGTLAALDYATTPTTLVSFNLADGSNPAGSLIINAAGDLFGATAEGGASGLGTVFEIVPTADPTGAVTVSAFLAQQAALDATAGGFAIADTAAQVASAIDALNADSHVTSITLTDSGAPTLFLTPTQAAWDAALLARIANVAYEEIIGVSGQPALSTSAFGGGFALAFGIVQGATIDLQNTNNNWDAINGSDGQIFLNSAQASVSGGNDIISFVGGSGNAVALYATNNIWDYIYGSNATIAFNNAQANLSGGGNTLNFVGSTGNVVSIYATGGNADNITGSNGFIALTSSQANVTGGGDTTALYGSGDIAALIGTNNVWDYVYGSNATITFNNAQANVSGGGNTINFLGASGNLVSLYATSGVADAVNGLNGAINMTNAQASATGNHNSVYFYGNNTLTANGASDFFVFQSPIGLNTINGFDPTDTLLFKASDFADWNALLSHMSQSGADTIISLDPFDTVTLTGVTAANLTASQFKCV
jgi:uncharacterized repeat protein (TIGR03803 family)